MDSTKRTDAYIPEVADAIVKALARGVPFRWACEAHGIPERTGHNWRRIQPDFDDRVRQNRGAKVGDYYSTIVRAAEEGDLKAAKWLVDKAESSYHDGDRSGSVAGDATVEDQSVTADREAVRVGGFGVFARLAWPEVDASELVWNWHLDEVCGELEAAVRARLERNEAADLAIATPPGSGKSRPISILLQPWAWTIWPWSSWITSAYDDGLAARFSRLSKMLVRSDWYQKRWPLKIGKDADHYWDNAQGGKRIAVGIGSRITGEHAHVIIGDDLVKEQLARIGTPAAIAQAVGKSTDFWFGTLSTRAIDHKATRIIVQQRLHRDDPIGVAVERHGYRSVVFRARYDEAHPDPMTYHQHQRAPGELLCPPRMTEESLAKLEFELGPTAARAQLQQEPVPPGGQMLKAEYMAARWDTLPVDLQHSIETGRPSPGEIWISSWDLAFKGKPTSDWTVGQVWCAFDGRRYLVDEVRGRWGFREARAQLVALAARYPLISRHLLEDAANAAATSDDLAGSVPGVVLEPVAGGCLARTQSVEGVWASGCVVLPRAPWVDGPGGFIEEHLRYIGDGTETDDRVAASSLALLHLKASSTIPAWQRAAQATIARQRGRG